MNNILAAQVLRSHLPEITDGAYKTAMEIAIETLYRDAYEDWKKWHSDKLSAIEYLELTEEEWYYWIFGEKKVADEYLLCPKEKELREKITKECSRKALFWDKENKYTHNYFVSQDNKSYDFQGCPDHLECVQEDHTFLALCDEVNNFECKDCWKLYLRGGKC